MPKIQYQKLRFTKEGQKTIDQAIAILEEYHAKGYSMTLRQLYYQFVSRGLVKENTIRQYKRLGEMLSKARIAGQVDWYALTDNKRPLHDIEWMIDKEYIPFLKAQADSWNIDLWSTQKYRPEVWIEKDALSGVVSRICEELEIPFFAASGYSSQSAQWRAGMRLRKHKADGYEPIIFHMGDHDPSGVDMTRDNENKLWMFGGFPVQLERLALNMDQIKLYDPPPMPAKKTDSRTGNYKKKYGNEGWELDALSPEIIEQLIRDAVTPLINKEAWDKRIKERDEQREEIKVLVAKLEPKPPEDEDPYEWKSPFGS